MGESKADYAQRLGLLYERQRQEAAKGRDFSAIDSGQDKMLTMTGLI